MKEFISETIMEKYEFRNIRPEETDQAIMVEKICFPPNEACSDKDMKERILKAPELFLVAEDRKTGKIAGFLNGIATDEEVFRDEFFTDITLNDPKGENIMLLGLDVQRKRKWKKESLSYLSGRKSTNVQKNGI